MPPRRLCSISKSTAVFISIKSPHLSLPILPSSGAFRYHLHTSFPVNISTFIGGKTDCGLEKKARANYLMRSRSVRLVFTVIFAGLHLIILIFNLDEVFHLVWKWDSPGRRFTQSGPAFKVTLLFSPQRIVCETFLPFWWFHPTSMAPKNPQKNQLYTVFGKMRGSNLAVFTWLEEYLRPRQVN